MKVVHRADVKAWQKVGELALTYSPYINFGVQAFVAPRGEEKVHFSVFAVVGGANLVFPVTNGGRVVMVQQYWQGIDRCTWTAPGGRAEESEILEVSARRELLEETGYSAGEVVSVGSFCLHPRYSPTRCDVLFATGCCLVGLQKLDPLETVGVAEFEPVEFWGMVRTNCIDEPYTVLAAFFAALHGVWPFPE